MPFRRQNTPSPLAQRLVLADFLLSQISGQSAGYNDQETIATVVKNTAESEEENGLSRYCQALCSWRPDSASVTADDLARYDDNIARLTRRIGDARGRIHWKYFQYLALLFTEIYLERFFGDREKLLDELNQHRRSFANNHGPVPEYAGADLSRLALWSATGSGKTLLMHANLLQFSEYAKRAGRRADYAERPILLVPNDGLSVQHASELRLSDIPAQRFDKKRGGDMFRGVDIVSIHQLREEDGDKTVAVSSFGRNNIVFVDEGHRGASGEIWREMRERLISDGGFSFEYSATFAQVAGNAREISDQYAKTIWFDYSYRRFHTDGYGKDYRIYNLRRDSYDDDAHKRRYLCACLLTFYRQLRTFTDKREALKNYRIEKPLWVFVGARVNAIRSENRRPTSDVYDVLRFIDDFVNNRAQTLEDINELRRDGGGLLRDGGGLLLPNSLIKTGERADTLFADVLRHVFNANAPAKLHLRRLPQADGEIEIRIGNNRPFGVINIGDAAKFLKLCKERDGDMVKDDATFAGSHFADINRADSPITLLVGAKKFTEGWNSWRVSTMGLMNIGRGEGPEIIQLFGRGVRLKGWKESLMRQTFAPGAPESSDAVKTLETLNIFGLRADFMENFRKYLKEEGALLEREEITLPIFQTPPDIDKYKLKIIRAEGKTDDEFQREKSAEVAVNGAPVSLDWRARVQIESSGGRDGGGHGGDVTATIPKPSIALANFDRIYSELQLYKADRERPNLEISRDVARALIDKDDWYALYCPEDAIAPTSSENIRRCEDILITLLKKYADSCYLRARNKWESEARRYVNLTAEDSNFVAECRVTVDADKHAKLAKELRQFAAELKKAGKAIKAGDKNPLPFLTPLSWESPVLHGVTFCRHLYQPLLYLGDGADVEIVPHPVTLNEGEKRFVEKMFHFLTHGKSADAFADKTLFLLRNRPKEQGVTFFADGGFSPDFIMWVLSGKRQDIVFLDPKGIRQLHGVNHPKLLFHKTIKEEEKRLAAQKGARNIRLHSFILSVTPFAQVDWARQSGISKDELKAQNCLFMEDSDYLKTLFAKISR